MSDVLHVWVDDSCIRRSLTKLSLFAPHARG